MKKIAGFMILLTGLWFSSPASAQSVKIPPVIKGSRGAWIIVAPVVDGGAPKWRIDPNLQEVDLGALLPAEFVSKLKGKVFTSAVDGSFKIEIWCAKANEASDIATCMVVVGSAVDPPPPKKELVGHFTFIATQESAGVVNDASLRLHLESLGIKVYVLPSGDPNIKAKKLTSAVEKAGGPPCVIIQDVSGNVLGSSTITTAAAVKDFVTLHMGK